MPYTLLVPRETPGVSCTMEATSLPTGSAFNSLAVKITPLFVFDTSMGLRDAFTTTVCS
ncbi:hypothetical protein D3C80_2086040 [compost metagenome]